MRKVNKVFKALVPPYKLMIRWKYSNKLTGKLNNSYNENGWLSNNLGGFRWLHYLWWLFCSHCVFLWLSLFPTLTHILGPWQVSSSSGRYLSASRKHGGNQNESIYCFFPSQKKVFQKINFVNWLQLCSQQTTGVQFYDKIMFSRWHRYLDPGTL